MMCVLDFEAYQQACACLNLIFSNFRPNWILFLALLATIINLEKSRFHLRTFCGFVLARGERKKSLESLTAVRPSLSPTIDHRSIIFTSEGASRISFIALTFLFAFVIKFASRCWSWDKQDCYGCSFLDPEMFSLTGLAWAERRNVWRKKENKSSFLNFSFLFSWDDVRSRQRTGIREEWSEKSCRKLFEVNFRLSNGESAEFWSIAIEALSWLGMRSLKAKTSPHQHGRRDTMTRIFGY